MNHRDHLELIRDGIVGAGRRWLELGAGEGAFTLALADVLGPGGSIVAVDRDGRALATLRDRLAAAFPEVIVRTDIRDFATGLPAGPFDGTLAANCLHFLADPLPVLRAAAALVETGGRIVVVEYDADRGNPWVPHPFSARRGADLLRMAGFADPLEIGRRPSRFLGAIYALTAAKAGA